MKWTMKYIVQWSCHDWATFLCNFWVVNTHILSRLPSYLSSRFRLAWVYALCPSWRRCCSRMIPSLSCILCHHTACVCERTQKKHSHNSHSPETHNFWCFGHVNNNLNTRIIAYFFKKATKRMPKVLKNERYVIISQNKSTNFKNITIYSNWLIRVQ